MGDQALTLRRLGPSYSRHSCSAMPSATISRGYLWMVFFIALGTCAVLTHCVDVHQSQAYLNPAVPSTNVQQSQMYLARGNPDGKPARPSCISQSQAYLDPLNKNTKRVFQAQMYGPYV